MHLPLPVKLKFSSFLCIFYFKLYKPVSYRLNAYSSFTPDISSTCDSKHINMYKLLAHNITS